VLLSDIDALLTERLAHPLPGHEAQSLMAPRPRHGWVAGVVPAECRIGVALLLLYPRAGQAQLVLTLRPRGSGRHAGQVSLPGGAVESGETLDEAALREAREEVGTDPTSVRMLGGLTPLHVPVSGFVLHPRIGLAAERPAFLADSREVERIMEVALERLFDPGRIEVERRRIEEDTVEIPYFRVGRERVWGATAMVLAEFLTLCGRPPDPWGQRMP
jgi:8-oxo-dGTP pyrophosphatase MutT (NUDIX family)